MGAKAESGERKAPPWAPLLWPAGAAFHGLASLRAALYRAGIKRAVSLPAPAIAVGNLTFGGTGKTPFTIYLAQRLAAMGAKPAVLLRGYGRTSAGARLVNEESREVDVGEEALLYKRAMPALPVAVGEWREKAAALIAPPPGIFLLDDAFQHLRVRRDANILLMDASRPGDLGIPPFGRLREPLHAAGRGTLLVVTRGSFNDLPLKFREAWGERPIIAARFGWDENLLPEGTGSLLSWRGRKVVALAGIGNPEAFFRQASEAGFVLAEVIALKDHARPDARLKKRVAEALSRTGAEALFTTEKDALKWASVWDASKPLVYPRLRAEVDDPSDRLGGIFGQLLQRPGKGSRQ